MIENNEPVDEQILPLGYVLADRYVLDEFIGSGGMGSVYKAHDKLLEEKVLAIKILHREFSRDSELTRRFLREVNMMHSVNHPNVVRTYDAGVHDGMFFYTMEHIEGLLLDQYVESLNQDYKLLGKIAVQICKGLEAIHGQNIVHRDLKPGNILISTDGTVKITDFGVARPVSSGNTTHREIMGSLDYIPPEVFLGHEISPASDFYSLGVILYGIATGDFPFDAEDPMAIVWKHVHEVPKIPSELNPTTPLWMDKLIMRLLEKEAEKRPQNAREVIRYIRKKIYTKSEVMDSGAHELEDDGESVFDTNIYETEFDSKDDNPQVCLFEGEARKDSFTSACNSVIFDALPTVDEIKKHEEMWQERKNSRPDTDDLKGLAAKIRKVENFDKAKSNKKLIVFLAIVFSLLLLLFLISKLDLSDDSFGLDFSSIDLPYFSQKESSNKNSQEQIRKEISIRDLREEYISGVPSFSRNSNRKSNTRKLSSRRPANNSLGKTYVPEKEVGYFKDNSFQDLANVFYSESSSNVYVDPSVYYNSEQSNQEPVNTKSKVKPKSNYLNDIAKARQATKNEYQYNKKSRKDNNLRTIYNQRLEVKKEIASLNGKINAYSIKNEKSLVEQKKEAEVRRKQIAESRNKIREFNKKQKVKQNLLNDIYTDINENTDLAVVKKLTSKNERVKESYEKYKKAESEFSSLKDKIREGKISISKSDIKDVREQVDINKSELLVVVKSALKNNINFNEEKLEDANATLEINNYLDEAQQAKIESMSKQWKKISAGTAEKKEVVVSEKEELEKKLEELNKLMSDE